MVHSDLTLFVSESSKPKVCAVSYVNTVPLVWGALHGPQRESMELSFAVPSACADAVVAGQADVGIIPVIETHRNNFDFVPGLGIACRGPVRSILLVSKVPFGRVRTLAVDSGSRTSVQLSRVILAAGYGAHPVLHTMAPDLDTMLDACDAALLIGDAALRVDPLDLGYPCLDLGEEWINLTGLPMVFALWSGRREKITPALSEALEGSCRYGLSQLDQIVESVSRDTGFSTELLRQYFTRNVTHLLGDEEMAGMRRYLEAVRELDDAVPAASHTLSLAEGDR